MKSIVNSPVARVQFERLVGSAGNRYAALAKKISRKRERAMLKDCFYKEAVHEAKADIADRAEADRVEREKMYHEMIVRMTNRRSDKQLPLFECRKAFKQGKEDSSALRKDAYLVSNGERQLVASCG
jgi:hypothetical protein